MKKEEQKKLITEIMNDDVKDGLYKQDISKMETTQTAVEWLAERYNYITWMRNRDEISAGTADEWRDKFLKEAKAMEKEQIVNASSISYSAGQEYHMLKNNKLPEQFAEQYYNETYNK